MRMKRTPKSDGKGANQAFFEITSDADGNWHWLLWSGNGRMIARNPQEYAKKKDCLQAAKTVAKIAASAKTVCESQSAKEVTE